MSASTRRSDAFATVVSTVECLRFDTSGEGEKGPRWREERSGRGYTVRHPEGF